MSKGFQDAVWNGLDTRRYNLENMPEYTPPEDVGYIKSIGQNVLSGIESTLGGAGMFIGANMASGSPDYSKGGMMGKASNVGRDFGAGLMNESQYLLNDAEERQAKYGASAMDWGGLGEAITNPDYWLSPRGLTADVAQGIGSSLPTLVAGGIGGKVASPLLSAIASGIGRQALKEGAASAAGKALSYMGGFGVGGGASEAISDAGSNYNDILQNLQGKVNPDGTPMYDEQGAITEATRRMNDLGLSEMPYLMASNALTGGMVAGKMSKLLGQDSKSIGRRALANVFGAGADMTGEGFTEVAQTTLANDAMDKPSGNMWNPREWDEAQSDSFRGGFMGALLPAAGGGAYNTVFGDIDTSDGVEQLAPQVNNNLFGAGTAEISTQGADIDEQVAHLKDGYQSVIPQVAGVLVNDFGIEGAQISSGFRTREHNKEVGGAENSYHVGDGEHGDALDIVLPDGVSAETAEAIKQRFKNSGVFDEVLFHDAGSGYHLHLGGLKTDNIGNSYGSYSGNADVDSAINEMAEKYNLDPALLAAIAEQESGFNQSAQSEAGAMGIMQLMPGTAEGLGVDPSDLRGNLEGGAKYLRQMLDKYDGDVEKALAAYNAGPGSLDSVNGDISQLSGETQKYVPSVMERYNKFKNKSGGGISSSGNILDWDSTSEDFSKLDFFPKDGEQSQGTVNEFLENLAKLEESDDKAAKEKGRQAQDILQQYGDDTEKLTEKAKELGYQQTVNPAEVHGRIPMRRIVSTALNNGQVTFATKKAADIFASSPIGQTMERQGKTFKVTDNFKMNEQVNAISQQIYSGNTARTKTVSNGVTPDVASQGEQQEAVQSTSPESTTSTPLSAQEVDYLNGALQTMPEELRSKIQSMMANKQYDDVRAAIQKYTSNPANKLQSSQAAQAGDTLNALLNIPEAMSNSTGTRIDGNKIRSYIESGNLPMMNRAINAMSQNLREHGMDPQKALGIYDVNTLPAVQGERMPSTDVQREEPAIEGTVEDTVITPPYNGKPAYNENQLEAPAIESDHLNSEDFLAGLSPIERGFMEYLDKMFDNLQLGFNDVLEYLRARQKDIFNKRMESVIQQGPQGLTGAFYTNGGKMVVDNNMPQEVQNAWNQLLSMRKNFGASLANSTAEIQNEYMRVESVVKDYLTTAVTEQCKNNVSWRKLNYAITGLEAIADKARRYERSVSEEGKRGSTKSYRDVSAEEGQAIEDSAVAWSGAIHQYGTTETRLRSFLNTLGSNFTKNNHGMALRAKTKYKGQPMNKAGRIEALIRDGGRVEERGKEYFAVSPNGDETKVTKGEHNYYKWLRQNGFAQQDRAPEDAPQLAKNNGVTEDSYRARQPEYHGKESHEEDVKKEESTKGQTKPQSNDNPNSSNEPMRKELIEQAAANEDTWVNSKKSELHLEDDNDTVVKLTPQELKYYQDLVKKGVVAKPELYEEAQEDVGEMDDNVEMSKEQKQLYDESSDDRDVPDSDSEPHTSGKSTKVVTADGKEYNVHYEVRPESEITASNNLDGSVNKDYPSELQPRNRQRVGNLTQVAEIAGKLRPADLAENRMLNHGAPLIREDGVVLNGNGRIMAIRTAVKNGTDHGYKQYLIDHAEELGLNPDNIEHMENPVLVKVVDDELTADDVKGITTDTSGGQRMSASEQAKTDAKKIKPSTLNMYQPNESGELMGNNKYFLGKLLENILPADERNAYYTEDGSISKDGLMRAQRALFALAYGNDKLIDTFAETTNEQAKNLINALNANAATIAKLQRMIENGNAHDLKLRDNLVNAINALRSAVLDGKPAERIWKETSMFEEAELTPETKALAKAMDGFRKSGKKLTNFIAQLADNNLKHGDPKQETMFEGTDDFSLMKDIASAKDKIANGGQANIFEAETIKRSRINIHSAEAQKENGNSNTELDRLPKVPIAKLRQSEQKIVRFGKAIGVPVHFVESSDTTNRGVFTHNGEIFINRKAKVPAHSIFVHEFVHWLKASPENAGAYDVLHACLENSNGLFNEARINKYRGKIFDGNKMTDEEIVEEIICDAMTQTESAEKLMHAVNNVDSNLVTRIAGCLKAMWDKFCEYMNFKQHKMSNEQHLPNELSVAEFQRADTAFNKILMNLKNDNGEPVFHRIGTELLLRDTNAKPVEAYQINPISYIYAVAYSRGFNLKKNPHNPQKQHNSSVLLDSEDGTYKTIQINYLFYEPQPNESQEYRVARRKAELVRFDTDTLFHQGDTIESLIPKSNKEALEDELKNDALSVIITLKDNEFKLANSPLLENETEEKRISKLFVVRGGLSYVERLIRQSEGTAAKLRTGRFQGIFGLDVSSGQTAIERIRQRYQAEINNNPNNVIKLSDKHSKQGAFLMPENGKPYTMSYYHNTQPSPKMTGDMFAQSIEPAGEYIAHDTMNGSNQIPGFEYGEISFKSPLVLEHKSTGHGGWKTDLSNMFGGKKGKALSNAIKKAGHDGIITIDSKTGEILETVNLAGTKNGDIASRDAFFDTEKHKQAQLEIVQNTNPMTDDYHVGIRTVEDIRTAEEAFKEADPDEAYVYPDFTEDDAQEALSNGKITVYSSYPIGQGVFVSPSRMMAEDYAGGGKIYSAEVSLKDVAWINDSEGMLAKVDRTTGTSRRTKYSRSIGVDLSPSTDGVAIAARANNNLVANMKGIVKKANAKFNPFHHEDLENLRIDKRDEEKDLNLIEYQFVSPTREGKKYKVIMPFITKGKQAMAKQEKLRFEFNEGMNEVDKLLGWREGFHRNDSKFKERKEALNEILLKGDLEGKEFTNDELIKAGYDTETIKGYRKMRALLDKAWKLANDTKSRIKYQSITSSTLRRAEADFADLKDKNPFAEIISKVHNPDGTVTINYKAPHVRRVAKQTVLPSELENLRKNKDVHIVGTTQSLKGTTQVTYYQREAGMGKLKGYIPHVFHGWYVCKVDKDGKAIVDEDGNVAMDNIVTTANSLSEAAKLGRELAKANPNANYRVVPQTFSAPGAQEQAIVMGDFDYAKIVGKVADSMSMSITDAQAMLDNTVKMKNRGRFYGYAKQRKGFKGFEQNVYLATMKYFNQTARYAAMDSFKRDSISMYNRIFGAFNDENVTKRSAMAKWTKQYISDMNGTPTWIEKMINNTLHNFGLGEERAGGRPALWLQQKIFTYPMTILKLGVFNPSSALLNLTQLFNLYGAMGEKVLSPQAYQRLLHKGFADTFRAMNNKDSELGRLLWKDLGLDYQIGMDVASGYSNAEVNNLASLRGFAGRLAGKSMYLFRQSDAFARGVTLLTAYNKALDEGKSKAEAIEYAKEINDKVNFDYSVADEPTIFRALGPISKVFLQFKKYPVKQLELFQDFYLDGRELGLNRKQAALRTLKYMAPYMAMSGMMGIPFISLAGGLLSALVATATGDDDWDWEKKIKQYMITEFGEDSPITQWWLYGAGSFIGLNLGSRVGVGDFMGSDSYNSADGLGGLMWNQTTLGSTINQVSRQLSYRNYAEALKAINPTLGNIALAYKGEVRTTRGRMKYQYQNMAERMWRAIGFTPLNETLAGDLASNEYAEKQEQTKAKQEAIDDFLADPSSENAARLNELGVTPKSLENESARRTMNRHQLNELAKEKEEAKKKKKPKTYSASDYLKAVQ